MLEAPFGLTRRPFPSLPQTRFYYASSAAEYARQTLIRCVDRGEGVAVVVGPTGCGKSLLGQVLADHFAGSMHVVPVASGRLESRRALLQAILYGLGRPFRGMEEGELRLALAEFLSRSEDRRPMLLLVDEAEALSLRLLDELRMTTNLAADGGPCCRLVLMGGVALEEKLTSPKLESFSQRITARCYLEAMNRTETRECIRAQLAAASAADVIFTDEACDSVYQATDGVPRLINQLCDHALLLAFADGRTAVGRTLTEEAWADLQQLPTPWNAETHGETDEPVIEFGGLNDGTDSLDSAEALAPETEDMAYSIPALKITPDEEDLIAQSDQRLDGLEETLSRLDDDFEPAGTIKPEIELVFHDPTDLLNEDFQEEEVVVDRYSPSSATAEDPISEEDTYPICEDDPSREAAKPAEPALPATEPEEVAAELQENTLDDLPAQLDLSDRLATVLGNSPEMVETESDEALGAQAEVCHDPVEHQSVEDEVEDEMQDEQGLDGESHTLDIHTDRPVPRLRHKDFARLFSNLRKTAQ